MKHLCMILSNMMKTSMMMTKSLRAEDQKMILTFLLRFVDNLHSFYINDLLLGRTQTKQTIQNWRQKKTLQRQTSQCKSRKTNADET